MGLVCGIVVTCIIISLAHSDNIFAADNGTIPDRAPCIYGSQPDCHHPCHCNNNVTCHRTTGSCGLAGCDVSVPWAPWSGLGCQIGNVALGKMAYQSNNGREESISWNHTAEKAVDGNLSNNLYSGSCAHPTASVEHNRSWWMVDLEERHVILNISIVNRNDRHRNRIHNTSVYVTDQPDPMHDFPSEELCTHLGNHYVSRQTLGEQCTQPVAGRYVVLRRTVPGSMNFCEIILVGYHYHECDYGYYGLGCVQQCHCQDDCDKVTGTCPTHCVPGRQKPACQSVCEDGSWGVDCLQYSHCFDPGDIPDKITGYCMSGCAPGWWGDSSCSTSCNCANENEVCDSVTGACASGCAQGFARPSCVEALPSLQSVGVSSYVINGTYVNVTMNITDLSIADYYTIEYRVYKTDWTDWILSATFYPNSTYYVIQVPYINCQYHLRVVPHIHTRISHDSGTSSVIHTFLSNCELSNEPRCTSMCQCYSVPEEICVKTSAICYTVCDPQDYATHCDLFMPRINNTGVHITTTDSTASILMSDVEPDNKNLTALQMEYYTVEYKMYGLGIIWESRHIRPDLINNNGDVYKTLVLDNLIEGINYTIRVTPIFRISSRDQQGLTSEEFLVSTLRSTEAPVTTVEPQVLSTRTIISSTTEADLDDITSQSIKQTTSQYVMISTLGNSGVMSTQSHQDTSHDEQEVTISTAENVPATTSFDNHGNTISTAENVVLSTEHTRRHVTTAEAAHASTAASQSSVASEAMNIENLSSESSTNIGISEVQAATTSTYVRETSTDKSYLITQSSSNSQYSRQNSGSTATVSQSSTNRVTDVVVQPSSVKDKELSYYLLLVFVSIVGFALLIAIICVCLYLCHWTTIFVPKDKKRIPKDESYVTTVKTIVPIETIKEQLASNGDVNNNKNGVGSIRPKPNGIHPIGTKVNGGGIHIYSSNNELNIHDSSNGVHVVDNGNGVLVSGSTGDQIELFVVGEPGGEEDEASPDEASSPQSPPGSPAMNENIANMQRRLSQAEMIDYPVSHYHM